MKYIDFIFINIVYQYELLFIFIIFLSFLLGVLLNDENLLSKKSSVIFSSILISTAILLLYLVLYSNNHSLEEADIERLISDGYLESGSSNILIYKMTKDKDGKDIIKYKKVNYSMVGASINEYKSLNPTKPVIERDAQSDRIVEILKRVN